jgi:NAD(P)H-nitrite reductase large subunit
VVAGGGPAAVAAVEELRNNSFVGSITVLCGEPTAPYDRTECSKGIIDGHRRPADTALTMPAGAHWRLGQRAVEVEPRSRVVISSTGERYEYDGLIIATGTRAEIPDGWPVDGAGIFQLRTVNDALAVRRAMRSAGRVAIVGGGLTGCELACGVLQTAREAVIVDANRTLLRDALGEQLGSLVTKEHRSAGIDTVLGRSVSDIGRRGGRFRLRLDDGDTVSADLVVLASGQRPDTDWLVGAGFDLSDGVLCDEALRVVGGDGTVVAAGAVARWPNLRYGGEASRSGHWVAAMEQGCAAARTLLAGDDNAEPFTLVPRFSSHQYRLRMQAAGRPDLADEVKLTRLRQGRHGPARSGVVATYHRGERMVGVAAINAPAQFAAAVRAHYADGLDAALIAEVVAASEAAEPVPPAGDDGDTDEVVVGVFAYSMA